MIKWKSKICLLHKMLSHLISLDLFHLHLVLFVLIDFPDRRNKDLKLFQYLSWNKILFHLLHLFQSWLLNLFLFHLYNRLFHINIHHRFDLVFIGFILDHWVIQIIVSSSCLLFPSMTKASLEYDLPCSSKSDSIIE